MSADGVHRLPLPPPLSGRWALFLDFDGTLVGFADHPERVQVPPSLVERLGRLSLEMDGALALVSGRQVATLDRLFAPLVLPAAGLHGLEWRHAGRALPDPVEPPHALAELKRQAVALVAHHPDAVFEDKGEAIGLHWRAAPDAAADLQAFAIQALTRLPGYQLQPGDCMVELRSRRADKGSAIAAFLEEVPFRDRLPVFVGDDLTDEHGFEVVNARGGLSVLVGDRHGSAARHRLADIAAVHAWLGAGN
ncbi:MAG TPA: trehalose-phosphatase [Luteimonas sp.]|nr:trehalose-phosphatase [Luteimonas sp.]HRP73123.1 trehalose-phosphatase [Luteimonas sp.]